MKNPYCVTVWLIAILTIALWSIPVNSREKNYESHAGFFFMKIKKIAAVRKGRSNKSAQIAKIYPGAVLKFTGKRRNALCPRGWMELATGGYVCSDKLVKTDEKKVKPSSLDDPEIKSGLKYLKTISRKTYLFKSEKAVKKKRPHSFLLKDSFLTLAETIEIGEKEYYRTRKGYLLRKKNAEIHDPFKEVVSYGIADNKPFVGGIIIGDNAKICETKKCENYKKIRKYSVINTEHEKYFTTQDGWVDLLNGKYIRDKDISVVRKINLKAKIQKSMKNDISWLAVDLSQQMVHAFEGKTLVRVMLCSTGIRKNTYPGLYKIQWKRRMQTMRLKKGKIRIEDVQWVMYYDYRDSIAIHSAYWHEDFGKKKSHGCVNLAPADAKWVFEWTTPHVNPCDSERFSAPGYPGSPVYVFY